MQSSTSHPSSEESRASRASSVGAPMAADHVARLADALHRLSSHRDDDTAVAALALLELMRVAGPGVTAQEFEPIYRAIFHAQWRSVGTATRAEWKAVQRLSAETLQALVREWRDRAVLRAAATTGRGDAPSPSGSTSAGPAR